METALTRAKCFQKLVIVVLVLLILMTSLKYGFTQEYTLKPGDVVVISTLGQPDFTRSLVVPPGGKINYPLVGEIDALGLTPARLASKIGDKLSNYIPHPQVTVILQKFRAEKVYVLGEVRNPGEYTMKEGAESVRLIEVLARVGGPTKMANLKKAEIITPGGKIARVDLHKLWNVHGRSSELTLYPGDTLFIPAGFKIKWSTIRDIAMTISYLVSTYIIITR